MIRLSPASLLIAAALLGLTVPTADAEVREVVILSTNDFHSAIDPIPAYWLDQDPTPHLGGAAQLMTLVEQIRQRESQRGVPVFLFDSGDMFTGMLAKLTRGEVMMEMMMTLRYDALGIGNHEFDYGWQNFRRQMDRASFPSLGANIFYKGTGIPYSRPHAIIERGGVRLGVIGIIGEDARSVVLPSFVAELEFTDAPGAVAASIEELEPDVDLIVVLAHQGHTGPMQTDAEHHPEVQRDFETDIEFCGRVPGIDVFLGGHAHRGIEPPYVHPQTGSIISQTYGYGTRLGHLRLWVDTETGTIVRHEGELVPVWSDELAPDPAMTRKMDAYKAEVAPIIGEVVGQAAERLVRSYNTESSLGSFASDALRKRAAADVAFMNAGGLRADLPAGDITLGNVQDAFPFLNTLAVLEMSGAQIRAVVEQGLTLLRGMIQVSGLTARYDLGRPVGQRLVSLEIGPEPVDDERIYRVATANFMAEGGDLYETFTEGKWVETIERDIAHLIVDYLQDHSGPVPAPSHGRLIPLP